MDQGKLSYVESLKSKNRKCLHLNMHEFKKDLLYDPTPAVGNSMLFTRRNFWKGKCSGLIFSGKDRCWEFKGLKKIRYASLLDPPETYLARLCTKSCTLNANPMP